MSSHHLIVFKIAYRRARFSFKAECAREKRYLTYKSCVQYSLSSRALGLAAFRPSVRASKGILHTNHLSTNITNVV